MSILQFSPVKVGQMGVKPATYKMVSTNTLAEITTSGFLKQGTGGQFLERNDLIEVIASFGTVNVENAQLYVTIDTNGLITLNADLPEGLGTAALKAATNNGLPNVASTSGAFVIDQIVTAADVAGSVKSSGVSINAVQLSFQTKVNRTGNIGGAGAGPINVPVAGLTTNSVVVASVESSSNPVSVIVCDGVVNGFNITFSADPGAVCIISYIAYIATQ